MTTAELEAVHRAICERLSQIRMRELDPFSTGYNTALDDVHCELRELILVDLVQPNDGAASTAPVGGA